MGFHYNGAGMGSLTKNAYYYAESRPHDMLLIAGGICNITRNCLFVCRISLTSGQLFNELFPDCTRSCFSQVCFTPQGR